MPEILTDEQADASIAGIEGAETVAGGEKPPLFEQAVGGEVDFAVHMEDMPTRAIG